MAGPAALSLVQPRFPRAKLIEIVQNKNYFLICYLNCAKNTVAAQNVVEDLQVLFCFTRPYSKALTTFVL